MNHQPGVKGVVQESVAQGINQALECPMIASYDYLTILGGDINKKSRVGVPLPSLPADDS